MRVRALFLFLVVLAVLLYGLSRAHILLFGPTLTVFSPQPHEEISQLFVVSGEVQNAVYLSVNDKTVLPDRSGLFEHALTLPVGRSIVEVYARSRQRRETVHHIPVIVIPLYAKKENNQEESGQESREEN